MRILFVITGVFTLFTWFIVIDISMQMNHHRKATEDLPQPPSLLRDYQIEVDNDSIYIWDGTREVGSASWGSGAFDSLILNDNR